MTLSPIEQLVVVYCLAVYLSQHKHYWKNKKKETTVSNFFSKDIPWKNIKCSTLLPYWDTISRVVEGWLNERKPTRRGYQIDSEIIKIPSELLELQNLLYQQIMEDMDGEFVFSDLQLQSIFSVEIVDEIVDKVRFCSKLVSTFFDKYTPNTPILTGFMNLIKERKKTKEERREKEKALREAKQCRQQMASVEKANSGLNWAKRAFQTVENKVSKTILDLKTKLQEKDKELQEMREKNEELENQLNALKQNPEYAKFGEHNCPICLGEYPLVMLVHDNTAHSCCSGCFETMKQLGHNSCPTCREPVEKVVKPFF